MTQQHGRAENRGQWVRHALACNVGRRTVDRLVQPARMAVTIQVRAKAGAGQQTHAAGQHAGLVGQDVTEQVLSQHHVVGRWPADQMHRHRVDQDVLQFDIGEFRPDDLCHDTTPEPRACQHVGFVD